MKKEIITNTDKNSINNIKKISISKLITAVYLIISFSVYLIDKNIFEITTAIFSFGLIMIIFFFDIVVRDNISKTSISLKNALLMIITLKVILNKTTNDFDTMTCLFTFMSIFLIISWASNKNDKNLQANELLITTIALHILLISQIITSATPQFK